LLPICTPGTPRDLSCLWSGRLPQASHSRIQSYVGCSSVVQWSTCTLAKVNYIFNRIRYHCRRTSAAGCSRSSPVLLAFTTIMIFVYIRSQASLVCFGPVTLVSSSSALPTRGAWLSNEVVQGKLEVTKTNTSTSHASEDALEFGK